MIDDQINVDSFRRETTLAVYGLAVVGMVAYTFRLYILNFLPLIVYFFQDLVFILFSFNVELIAVTFVTAGAVGYVT